jgi:hypothetical protein
MHLSRCDAGIPQAIQLSQDRLAAKAFNARGEEQAIIANVDVQDGGTHERPEQPLRNGLETKYVGDEVLACRIG